jgi:Flp pilus assembly protein TadG
VILLVAVVLLFVVGAMAVLAIDVVTFYTARSEAQHAADAAALTAARVMANSGATSGPSSIEGLVQPLASAAAMQVAGQNKVGGRLLNPATEVVVTFPLTIAGKYNPRVNVKITRADLPTFFARILGRTQVAVSASANAEAYNPSGASISLAAGGPIATSCTKPWLLPNLDPTGGGGPIFNPNGAIVDNTLVGKTWQMDESCENCTLPLPASAGKFFPAAIDPIATDPQQFPLPTKSLPACSAAFGTNPYQLALAACVPTPITCGLNANYKIDVSTYTPTGPNRRDDTVQATKCLIHDKGIDDDSDSIDSLSGNPPFQFVAGNENPIPSAASHNVLVSDSLVTIPVFKVSGGVSSPVQVIGFVQVFLNPDGTTVPGPTIKATIVNMAGCGESATGQPILGNGASAIPVRLVANP